MTTATRRIAILGLVVAVLGAALAAYLFSGDGRVTRVLAFTGKKVKRGELLAEIDAQDFEIQSRGDTAEIKRLQALLANQERVVERQQKLVGQGFISQNAVDEALAQRTVLREQLAAAR